MKSFTLLSAALLVALPAAASQTPLSCHIQNPDSFCEIREFTLPFLGSLDANTGGVGAITVKGWDNVNVLVRVQVTTQAEDGFRARLLAPRVEIDTSSNRIWASGPSGESWAAAYEIYVPRQAGLEVNTRVGAIVISDVNGAIHFRTGVGAVTLSGLAGEVEGKTGVGAITVALAGDRWDGKGLDISTGTGTIRITANSNYSAQFDLRTSLGVIVTNFPGARSTASGFLSRKLVFQAGAGGARIRAATSIGEIELKAMTPVPQPD